MKLNCFFLLILIQTNLFSQDNECEAKVEEIYTNIINSIGNNFPPAPELIISKKERAVAFISDKGITIERKVIEHFCKQDNFEDKIAYIISHELAHHYLNHDWMFNSGLSYASTIGEYLDITASSLDQRKLAETSADLFGGFFGQTAGYNVLNFGSETLSEVYKLYNIPKEIKGYPSFDERLQIIESKKKQAKNLSMLFDLGNIFLKLGEYNIAKQCFEEILKNKFNSREIYNNLGLVYLLYGISISEKEISKYNYPISLDFHTRANTESTRSNLSNDPDKMFKLAEDNFKLAKELDNQYLPSKQNLYVINFLKQIDSKKGRKELISEIKESKLNNQTKSDFVVLNYLINGKNGAKTRKEVKKGSGLSSQNISGIKKQIIETDLKWINEELNIDSSSFIFGFDRPYETIKTKNRDLDFKIKDFSSAKVIKSKKVIILKISAEKFNSLNLINSNYLEYKGNYYLKMILN